MGAANYPTEDSAVGDLPEALDGGMVPGDPVLVGARGIEGFGHEVEQGAGVRQRAVAVRDSGGDPHEHVLAAAGDDDLRLASRLRILADVVEDDLRLGRGREEPDVVLPEVVV